MSDEKSKAGAWEKAQAAATAEFEAIDKATSFVIDGIAGAVTRAATEALTRGEVMDTRESLTIGLFLLEYRRDRRAERDSIRFSRGPDAEKKP